MPPSLSSTRPTSSIERRAPAGMSRLSLSVSSCSKSSGDMLWSSSSVGMRFSVLLPAASTVTKESGEKLGASSGSGCTTGVETLVVAGRGAAGALVAAGRLGAGVGVGSSNIFGSSDSGASCATAHAEVSASEAPTSRCHALKCVLIRTVIAATPAPEPAGRYRAPASGHRSSRPKPSTRSPAGRWKRQPRLRTCACVLVSSLAFLHRCLRCDLAQL